MADGDGRDDPAKAEPGTLRKEFGTSIERNATHGSDAPETAAFELGYFFAAWSCSRPAATVAELEAAAWVAGCIVVGPRRSPPSAC